MRQLVVIGNGMVGHRLVEAVRDRDSAGAWHVVVLGEEPRPAYDRVALSSYFDGTTEEGLRLPDLTARDGVELRLGDPVVAVDRARRAVRTAGGSVLDYDALVLATGSSAFVPPVPGHDLPGCHVYRTIDDLEAITADARTATTGVVVGGGLLGLEAANALRLLGVEPHVVELAPWLMPAQVDEGGGALLGHLVTETGVTVHTGAGVAQVVPGADGRVARVRIGEGESAREIPAGIVVFAVGIRPRDQLARDAGLELGPRGGVAVDAACRTSDPAVYAVGECASIDGTVYGLLAPGNAMAEVAADRLLGGSATFPGADTSTKLKLLGVDVASFGDAHARTEGALEVVLNDAPGRRYAKLVVSDDAATLLGGVLVGDAAAYASLRPLVGRPLPGDPLDLIAPGRGDGGAGVGALPDDAQVCSCHAVTKGAITAAIAEGAADVPALKTCTKAGTGCGSCLPMLKSLLAESGVAQSSALCEHFPQSRAELMQIVLATGITGFTELITRYGRGRGCDVCKPAIASILATQGGHILDGEQAALQDTNDRFLANIQRNGTYSVVPRIPGGEITPDKLVVIGEVARDFGLYTKITGAQRIDMFGARVEQLPAIWRRLVDAGFESGHAYGKALRAVKSCVGTTWCRYGVQDSVALAVELELRYRGLRAPHKIKAGVSGCARECAEARGKDVGVIATENGWNLYVGGNGGFRPRHAELLVSDVDHDTLVRYIDRFLMFYIRTADRLQRTAAWMEAMDGGLDHLRAVVVEDSLGIAAELEAAMARHVAGYADEWRGVLDDPEKLARFVSFANAPDTPDPTITFGTEREQPVPAGPVSLGMPTTRPHHVEV
ncbi:nitrite reductase large subunit NirB [Marinitenerispora sediminis]|uniref:assimilatory sulfite reductase (ferredoxin) n=1 Tax=Marinitenerispora sediminis TaxID=1931232 RepID=A0A368T2B4_9ACTN|nr:nitrite reductase large subunit NirB [Marinitenerispora sediminis]RCV54842.1 nitrite reductase (NAD(P)H) [Marinitenerispora sediminis]RCV55070.1 nitrite reductase (NAD(P)H) [Marinitenerispora sediminis]RCV56244.1 nitrite reductase (NAD(P)H) [Marinitenerispora sediminis]